MSDNTPVDDEIQLCEKLHNGKPFKHFDFSLCIIAFVFL